MTTQSAKPNSAVDALQACALCHGPSVGVLRARDVNRRVSHATFDYVRCGECGSLSLRNVPADLGRYYPASYYDVPSTLAELDGRTANERYKLQLIQRWVTAGRLVEVGPAFGMFARVAQQAGYEVDTIEIDQRCCAFLRDVVGVGATQSDDVVPALERLAPADVIAMWHVLDLPSPGRPPPWRPRVFGLVGFWCWPRPIRRHCFRLFGRFWTHLDAPRHLHLLSSTAVAEHGRALGLEPVLITTTDAEASAGTRSVAVRSNLLRRAPLRAVAHLAGRILNKLVAPFERRGQRGSAYTIVLRRPVDL